MSGQYRGRAIAREMEGAIRHGNRDEAKVMVGMMGDGDLRKACRLYLPVAAMLLAEARRRGLAL